MDSSIISFHVTLDNLTNRFADQGLLGEYNKIHCSVLDGPAGRFERTTTSESRRVPSGPDGKGCLKMADIVPIATTTTTADNSNGLPSCAPMRKLKNMGWYWGSISPEYASRLLENEQDGSFLIRDSSSECYIFSMTFKLDGNVHHARIEHSKGHFSFGRSRKFFCTTIVEFIEQAIEYSKNGNLLFFLHRDPALEGPVRFRMIPFSRMRGSKSLQHMCRFAILPYVRKDKIGELGIPECLREYLHEPFH